MKKDYIKVYMYASSHCIKMIKVPKGINIFEETFIIRVLFKKYIFGSWNVKIAVRPSKMIKNIEGEIHTTIEYEKGIDI